MYKRKTINSMKSTPVVPIIVEEFEYSTLYKPFSYYVNGGDDPTGENMDLSNPTVGDTPEDIQAFVGVDAFADPRTNYFDVVEQVGIEKAQAAIDAKNAGEKIE